MTPSYSCTIANIPTGLMSRTKLQHLSFLVHFLGSHRRHQLSHRRGLRGRSSPERILTASKACSVPIKPGTGPSTPASEHLEQFSGCGGSGNRHR